ncbi:MAG: ATP-dependent helicase [Acidimicrobiia bacterium]|nr:ATP-dependent helicase [Acidimicrobiia bacterium]MDX2465929.1 ATP-dependent helicase [Acidimicrobiia bacterium]
MFASIPETPGWLEGLNDEQRVAVLHDEGPLLVIAGAGSGKTRTLASRVARLIDDGVSPDRILLLTFTRRASAEMLRRAGGFVNQQATGRVWGGTFHSIANRLLRRHATAVGLQDGFTVLDQSDSSGLFGLLRAESGFAEGKTRFPRKETIAAIYSRAVNAQEKLTTVLDERFPWCRDHDEELKEIFRLYTARKRKHNVVDFDDLLLYWRALLESPQGGSIRGLFDHVLVDEYQDTNKIQADILQMLCGERGNVTVVGDDAQAIYSFRAASVVNMVEFPEVFPSTTVVKLEQNYRSTPEILAAANAVIAQATDTFPKALWSSRASGPRPSLVTCTDEAAQADWVCDRVLEMRELGVPLQDQAVLFRTGHHSDGLEIELSRRKIPYMKFGGLRFLEAAHVKDLMSMLRILDNPRDELAWHRVLQLIPGVGPATARRIMTDLTESNEPPVRQFCETSFPVVAEARPFLVELQDALGDCSTASLDPGAQIERLTPFAKSVIERSYDDAAVRVADLAQLRDIAGSYSDRTRFLAEVTLDPPHSTTEVGPPHLDDDYLILSTVHSAKGGEWPVVHVIHAADGNIPSDMALNEPGGVDEERRLLYVALTRAKDHLSVSFPQRFYHRRFGGDSRHSYAVPSRFLTPVTEHFDPVVAGVPVEESGAVSSVAGKDTVAAVLESLWD